MPGRRYAFISRHIVGRLEGTDFDFRLKSTTIVEIVSLCGQYGEASEIAYAPV